MSARSEPGRAAPIRRDAAASKRRILQAALREFSDKGRDGARIEAIAHRAKVSKPMLYSYFGDKGSLYEAALREAYVQIRQGERDLQIADLDPAEAVAELVRFTLDHFVSKPWFIRMLNTENLDSGKTVRQMADAAEIQSPLLAQIDGMLRRGVESGDFRAGIDPTEFYIVVASLCYFPVSNRHTLRAVFDIPIDEPSWLAWKKRDTTDLLLRYLDPGGAGSARQRAGDGTKSKAHKAKKKDRP